MSETTLTLCSQGTLPGNSTSLCVRACTSVCEGALITKAERRSQIKTETERLKRVLHSSLKSLLFVGFTPASCSDVQRTHVCTITDVTRIQKGVAAYYILAAHTGYLAQLGLFKRLRLDKQRGFLNVQPVLHLLCLCLRRSYGRPNPHMQPNTHLNLQSG